MWLAYAIAIVPLCLGAVFYACSNRVTWWEWLASGTVGFVLAGVFHYVAIKSMTNDVETWSGRVTEVVHYPEWVEEYTATHTRTVGAGKNQHTGTYTTTEHRTHHECWVRRDDFGSIVNDVSVDRGEFDETAARFGGKVDAEKPPKMGFDGGDPSVYHVRNRTGAIIPLTMTRAWENRVKAAPSCFSFPPVSGSAKVFDWPRNPDPKSSDRVVGIARGRFSTAKWDEMCSRLGPVSRVNLIIVGFDADDSGLGHWQEAKWAGGKKNDLVLCYGTSDRGDRARWTYVFGWTEREDVKRNLETLLGSNKLGDDLLPKIESEVAAHYRLKDWTKFDYITVEPPPWAYLALMAAMVVIQGIGWVFSFGNGANKRTIPQHIYDRWRGSRV